MSLEQFILVAISGISIASVFYIPKSKYRLAFISFITFHTVTWVATLLLVELGSIEYPIRQFPRATQGSFILNFLFFPAIFTWFVLSFPSGAFFIKKILHYMVFVSVIVWFIYFISVYTDLENFKKGTPQSQLIRLYINFFVDFILCRIYVKWFSKKSLRPLGV